MLGFSSFLMGRNLKNKVMNDFLTFLTNILRESKPKMNYI